MGADLKEKRNLVLASGEYPDMFFKAGFEEMCIRDSPHSFWRCPNFP